MTPLKTKKVNRRTFLHVSAVAGGGLVIGLYAPRVAGQGASGGPAGGPGTPLAQRERLHHRQSQQHIHHRREEPGNGAGHQDGAAANHRRRVRRRLDAGLDQAGGPGSEVRAADGRRQPRDSEQLPEHAAGGRRRAAPDAERRRGAVERAGERAHDRQRHGEARSSNRTATYASLAARALTAADAGSRGGRSRAEEPARLQDHRQANPRRRQPWHRDRQGGVQHRSRARRHAVRRFREVPGLRRHGRQRQPR